MSIARETLMILKTVFLVWCEINGEKLNKWAEEKLDEMDLRREKNKYNDHPLFGDPRR